MKAQVEAVTSWENLEKHCDAWDDLAAHSIERNVFYESWMLIPALKHLAKEEVTTLLVWDGPTLIGLFPLVRKTGYRQLPFQYFSSWKHIHSFLCTPLVRDNTGGECLTALFEFLGQATLNAPIIEFAHFPGEGPFARELLVSSTNGRGTDKTDHHVRPFISSGVEENRCLRALPAKRVSDLNRRLRRLAEKGTVVAVFPDSLDGESLLQTFLTMERSGWKGEDGTALACREHEKSFFLEAAREGYKRKQVVVPILKVAGEPIAMQVIFTSQQDGFLFKVAYNESYSSFAPGVVLHFELLKHLSTSDIFSCIDSCTLPGDKVLEDLWTERRTIQSVVVGTSALSSLIVSGISHVARLRRRWKARDRSTLQ